MKKRRIELCLYVFWLVAIIALTAPMGAEARSIDHTLSGSSYVNRTDNCTLSLPAGGGWSAKLKNEKNEVLEFENGKLYGVYGSLTIERHPVLTLDLMKISVLKTYGKDALLNTVDVNGKKAILVEKTVASQNYNVSTRTYFIVKDSVPKDGGQGFTEGVAYIIVFGYLDQGDKDKSFLKQIEDIVQSFAYLDERPAKTSPPAPKGK